MRYTKDAIIKDIQEEMNKWAIGFPPLRVRADILIKFLVEMIAHRTQSESSYNPESHAKKNDGIDLLLTFSFILPAILCTADEKFAAKLKRLVSHQVNWIYTPNQLAEDWEHKTVANLQWPC